MSRPFSTFFTLSLAVSALGFAGCSTIYRPMYTNANLHYKAPAASTDTSGKPQKSAAEILKESDAAAKRAAEQNADANSVIGGGALMPPAATPPPADSAIPGMTPPAATPPMATPPPAN